ncbi:hypothetical protein M153_2630002524 [Pseudoloma neurophilia]|uniref:Uncharacterized protein n=1 Tax=Pseudoloma neurophilia TaxID=146866 RepID=A0A0R0LYS0_9MICR|nr:hypothetical protein M153_2630002524 [Pseudoloma neurophilia]
MSNIIEHKTTEQDILVLKNDLLGIYINLLLLIEKTKRKNSKINKQFLKVADCLKKVLIYENKKRYEIRKQTNDTIQHSKNESANTETEINE